MPAHGQIGWLHFSWVSEDRDIPLSLRGPRAERKYRDTDHQAWATVAAARRRLMAASRDA